MATAAPAAKWLWPAGFFAASGMLAIDGTQVSVALIGLAQASVIAYLGWRQFRAQNRQDQRSAELERETSSNTIQLQGQDRLIDQLQETTGTDRQLIATLQAEVGHLNREVIRLNRRLVAVSTGAMRLVAQLEQLDIEPVWHPATSSGEQGE